MDFFFLQCSCCTCTLDSVIANPSSPPLWLHFQFHPEIFKYFLALISCFCGKGGLSEVLFGTLTTLAANNHTLFSVHSPYSLIDFIFFPFSCFFQLPFFSALLSFLSKRVFPSKSLWPVWQLPVHFLFAKG